MLNLTEYQSIPFWSWNDKLEKDKLIEQIDWMKKKGIGGFFMHARGGLKTPYMSEEWMQCVDTCVKAAKERGMQAWVYDENGWPSGFAGGKLLEKEENHDCYLTYEIGQYDEESWIVYSMQGERLHRVHSFTEEECLNLYLHISPSTADILNEDVVEQFLAETHEKYAQRYGENFSESLAGFFTDEPQYFRWQTAYTRVMPKVYREAYGEDLYDSLGLLFVEKEGYRTFRYRYWYTMQHLMLKNFAEKIYNWCEEHGTKLTGHYVEENTLGFQMSCCAGVMPFYEFMHMPGIDWLNRVVGNKIPLRQIASAAAQLGKKQILSESFGCCGWDVTPTELRCFADFQYVGGVNRICHHLIPYSEHGQRKRDYPSHFSWINPWVNSHFEEFNDYYTRLGYLLANATEEVKVAMLHPIRSAYFDYKDNGRDGGDTVRTLDVAFFEEQERLSQAQIPFHFLDETLLERHGFVRENKIGCGLCEYEYLVLPTCYTMGRHTEHLLKQYVANGGRILLMSGKPTYLEGEMYDYSYLTENITFEELANHLPYRLKEAVPQVHSTLRKNEEGWFLFVQNYGKEIRTVSYELADGYCSFKQWDVATMTSKVIPTTVELAPNQSCVLTFSKNTPDIEIDKEVVHLSPVAEVLDTTDNYLTLDTIRYSKDGVSYSSEMPCVGVFQQLLGERYEGFLYIKYTFEVKEKPNRMALIFEKMERSNITINGHPIAFDGEWERDHHFLQGDVSTWILTGKNEIIREMYFYQSKSVYYALFGKGVTESLRNCLVYDTEIEAMYLAGKFGVYANQFKTGEMPGVFLGSDFYIASPPKTVESMVVEGYPFFSGTMKLRRTIMLKQTKAVLEFQGRFQAMRVWVNGLKAGDLLYTNRLDISEFAKKGVNEIVIELVVSNRNFLGPHHWGDEEEPISVTPFKFEMPNTWIDGKSERYRDSYAFVSVPIC